MSSKATITATKTVKVGPGVLRGIFIAAASGGPTLTVYDSETTGTTDVIIPTFTPVAATMYDFTHEGITVKKGIYAVIANTVTATFIMD